MSKQTVLLQHVWARAVEMYENDGRSAITADYFMLAFLQTLNEQAADQLPHRLKTATVSEEISAAEKLLSAYPFDRDQAFGRIAAWIHDVGYSATWDEMIFTDIERAVQGAAGDNPFDVPMFIKRILEQPTEAIKVNIISTATPVEEPSAAWLSEMESLLAEMGDAKAAPAESAETADECEDTAEETPEASDDTVETDEAEETETSGPTYSSTEAEIAAALAASGFAAAPEAAAPKAAVPADESDEEPTATDATPPADARPDKHEKSESGAERLARTVKETHAIQTKLLDVVYGQDQAINAFVSGYFQAKLMECCRTGITKPQATFLFAGPPGVGKTFLAESAARALKLPFCRFDMSEYSDKEANLAFCGSDKVYKNAKAGNVTSFVAAHPRCVLLFDEIEKAHINVIYLFLQMLDAGRLRDNFTDEEVSFSNAVIIFTTNVGKNLYDDPSVINLSALPRKQVLKALASDVDPITRAPLFPAAICSRFASGNVVMFNHLDASNLFAIAERELEKNVEGFASSTKIQIDVDSKVPAAIMLSEGGKADARTVKGRANAFFHEELYELFRLLASEKMNISPTQIEKINIDVTLTGASEDIRAMFVNSKQPEVLVFASGTMGRAVKLALGNIVCYVTGDIEEARDILFNHDISIVLCDINCGAVKTEQQLLNSEDVRSVGRDFLTEALAKYDYPVYLLQSSKNEISAEEFLSFAKIGVRDILTVGNQGSGFAEQVLAKCEVAYQQKNMHRLARENKVLTYKTYQTVSTDRTLATIHIFDFRLELAADAEDSKSILSNISKPNIHFADVIGAKDAKEELAYFVEYLKSPVEYMRKGVRAPKGVLLYGPPGTGKTLLAKAMAGESDVTFLRAEGNQFLKRYVGEGAQAVHDLFNAARKYAPSILFIDEIDAIAKDRSSGAGELNSDVLTAFLTEMDGFNTDTTRPVFVLAATNYDLTPGSARSLDPALLRRFDRRIYIDLPDKAERRRYLEMKAAQYQVVTLSPEQIENIAIRSTGMSLAELESVFEMALRNTIRTKTGVVDDAIFEEAFETFNSGERREWKKETLTRTARHEAGHALLCWLGGEKPSYLTIVARGDHGGYMQHGDHENKGSYTKAELLTRIRTSLAGRAAEIVYYGDEEGISTGASGDLQTATRIAEQMICNYGMDDTVGMSYVSTRELDAGYGQTVRERVNALLRAELANAVSIVRANLAAMDGMVEALLDRNHLKEQEIDEIFRTTGAALPT
ncbi:MAG: AAA family ATPase [Clostridia bacterium]|nr:AAA family ATPase [Clostridia bacterium]